MFCNCRDWLRAILKEIWKTSLIIDSASTIIIIISHILTFYPQRKKMVL